MKTFEEQVTKLLFKKISVDEAYSLGFDAGKNGSNDTNCDFYIFSSPENTKAWEKGKADAEKATL